MKTFRKASIKSIQRTPKNQSVRQYNLKDTIDVSDVQTKSNKRSTSKLDDFKFEFYSEKKNKKKIIDRNIRVRAGSQVNLDNEYFPERSLSFELKRKVIIKDKSQVRRNSNPKKEKNEFSFQEKISKAKFKPLFSKSASSLKSEKPKLSKPKPKILLFSSKNFDKRERKKIKNNQESEIIIKENFKYLNSDFELNSDERIQDISLELLNEREKLLKDIEVLKIKKKEKLENAATILQSLSAKSDTKNFYKEKNTNISNSPDLNENNSKSFVLNKDLLQNLENEIDSVKARIKRSINSKTTRTKYEARTDDFLYNIKEDDEEEGKDEP